MSTPRFASSVGHHEANPLAAGDQSDFVEDVHRYSNDPDRPLAIEEVDKFGEAGHLLARRVDDRAALLESWLRPVAVRSGHGLALPFVLYAAILVHFHDDRVHRLDI